MTPTTLAKNLQTPIINAKVADFSTVLRQHTATIDAALQGVFAPTEETRLIQARRIMGSSVNHLSNDELEVYLTEFQNMLDDWLDMFEREQFNGRTLKQVLGQG